MCLLWDCLKGSSDGRREEVVSKSWETIGFMDCLLLIQWFGFASKIGFSCTKQIFYVRSEFTGKQKVVAKKIDFVWTENFFHKLFQRTSFSGFSLISIPCRVQVHALIFDDYELRSWYTHYSHSYTHNKFHLLR